MSDIKNKKPSGKKQENKNGSKRKKLLLGILIPLGVAALAGATVGIVLGAKRCSSSKKPEEEDKLEKWITDYTVYYNTYKNEINDCSAALYKSVEFKTCTSKGVEITEAVITYDDNKLSATADLNGNVLQMVGYEPTKLKTDITELVSKGYSITYYWLTDENCLAFEAKLNDQTKLYMKFNNHAYLTKYIETENSNIEFEVKENGYVEDDLITYDPNYLVEDEKTCYASATEYGKWKKVESIEIPAQISINNENYKVIGIGTCAFKDCKAKTIKYQDEAKTNIKYIAARAFEGMNNLTNLVIPKNVIYVGGDILKDNTTVTSVEFETGISTLYQIGGDQVDVTDKTQNVTNLKNVGLTGNNWGATGLNTTDSSKWFEYNEQYGSLSITTVEGEEPTENDEVYIPSIFKGKKVKCIFNDDTIYPEVLGFAGCEAKKIEFVNPLEPCNIQYSAFRFCPNIKDFTIPASNNHEIGYRAFSGCSSLETVSFVDDSINTIYSVVFDQTSLTSIALNNKLKWYQIDSSDNPLDVTNASTNATNLKNCTESGNNWGYTGIIGLEEKTANIQYETSSGVEVETSASTSSISASNFGITTKVKAITSNITGNFNVYNKDGVVVGRSSLVELKTGESEGQEVKISNIYSYWSSISSGETLTVKFEKFWANVKYIDDDDTYSFKHAGLIVDESKSTKIINSDNSYKVKIYFSEVDHEVNGEIYCWSNEGLSHTPISGITISSTSDTIEFTMDPKDLETSTEFYVEWY